MTATPASPWRAAHIFATSTAVIGLSFGVLARTSGLSLVMTCAMSLVIFAGGSQFLAAATIASAARRSPQCSAVHHAHFEMRS